MTAIHLIAPTKIGKTIAYQYPAFGKGQPTLWWAQNGFVCYEDRRPDVLLDKRCGKISWQEAAQRVLAVSNMIPKRHEDPKNHFLFERKRHIQWQEVMVEVIREAKCHGGPYDNMKRAPRPKAPPPRVQIGDDFMVSRDLLRAGEKQANGIVRLAPCDF